MRVNHGVPELADASSCVAMAEAPCVAVLVVPVATSCAAGTDAVADVGGGRVVDHRSALAGRVSGDATYQPALSADRGHRSEHLVSGGVG